jgi:hypothetical protein
MQQHPDIAYAANEAIRAWRFGQVGALMGAYPEPSECLLDLVLIVDNQVAGYKQELFDRQSRKLKSKGG